MSSSIQGKALCFTGKLTLMTRAEASKRAKEHGATVTASLTSKTDILVIGPTGAGSKKQKAKKNGTEIWTEEQFNEVINGGKAGGKKAAGEKKVKVEAAPEDEPPAKKAKTTSKKAASKGKKKVKEEDPEDEPPAKKSKTTAKKKKVTTPKKEPTKTTKKKITPAIPATPGTPGGGRRVMRAIADGSPYEVYEDYDVKLMLSDSLHANSNKFYKLQLLQLISNRNHFFVATHWGRLGENGQSQLKGPHEGEDTGIKAFAKVFKAKTKNTWGELPFVRYNGKYQLVETTEDGDDDDGDAVLGRLTEEQIKKGQAVLKELRTALESPKKKRGKKNEFEMTLGSLSNEFYSLIPTKSGRQAPPRLDNLEIITEKEGLLEFWLRMGFEDVSSDETFGSPIDGVPALPLPKSLGDAASNITDKFSINSSLKRGGELHSTGAGNPTADITPDLYGAILLYTGNSIYREINRCLRLDWKKAKKYWNYLRLYFEAAKCFPAKEKTLWRGIAADLYDEYKVGKIITWWSISSCTSKKSVAEGFMNQLGSDATLLTLRTKTSCDISSLSFYPHEQESLLHPGTKLKVLSRKRTGKIVEIEVEEVVDDIDDDEIIIKKRSSRPKQ